MEMLQISSISFAVIFASTLYLFNSLTLPFSVLYSIISLKLANLKFDPKDDQKTNNDTSNLAEGEGAKIPNHVAVILDGNKLWAQKRGLPTAEGFEAGAKSVVQNVKTFFVFGVKTISLFTFSTDQDSTKPSDELNFLISLFGTHFKSEIPYFQREKIQVSLIGDREIFPDSLKSVVEEVEKATSMNQDKHLIVAINYSGKYDITEACKNIVLKTIDGQIKVEDINEERISNELQTMCSPFSDPDLLIRTKGEQMLSNFFLWQLAYTELYFTNVMWPDFGEAENLEALKWYQTRQRRFGQRI